MKVLNYCFIITTLIISALLSGCSYNNAENKNSNIQIIDSLGRQVGLDKPISKVVIANAYNTDLTELVVAIGAADTIVGVDQNILWNNEAFHNRFSKEQLICAREGLVLDYERIVKMQPDVLLISSKGSWFDAQEKLKPFGIKVVVIDTHDLDDFDKNCVVLGKIFGKEERATQLKNYFGFRLAYVTSHLKNISNRKRVYFECGSPGATTMPGSYFNSLVKYTGGINIMQDAVERHILPEAVVLRNPEYIIKMADRRWRYSYQPPTKKEQQLLREDIKKRPGWDTIDAVKKDNIFQLSYFSHCGASKIIGVLYVAKYLYPEYLPELNPDEDFKVWLEEYLGLPYIAGHTTLNRK